MDILNSIMLQSPTKICEQTQLLAETIREIAAVQAALEAFAQLNSYSKNPSQKIFNILTALEKLKKTNDIVEIINCVETMQNLLSIIDDTTNFDLYYVAMQELNFYLAQCTSNYKYKLYNYARDVINFYLH